MATPACASCGHLAAPQDRYCARCGSPIPVTCQCGRANVHGLPYCTGCGQPLHDPEPAGAAREERRRVSVLFIDAVGSTTAAEGADPEAVRRLQTAFFATVRTVVHRYGGVVEKYIGDAAMVLFGAPVATETDPVRCVRAGLDLQRALSRPGEQTTAWRFRTGIATGEALVDLAAAHDGGQAIVAGDVVNVAARLQAAAPAGGVLVCGATHAATRTEIRYTELEPLTLRGRSSPTEVWLALATVHQQLDRAADTTPMVGRDHELSLLTSALRLVVAERSPRLVTVLGPPGIGKSRLVRELYRHADRQSDLTVTWRTGRCPPFGENVAYAALAEIVRGQAGVLDTDVPAAARGRLDTALGDLVATDEAARLSDALRPLLGLPGSPLSTEDAEAAWRRFLLALAGRGPTVLVFEDLHWADARMLRFIELLGTTVRDVPLLIVCTARPELCDREPDWAATVPGRLTVSLAPLRDESIATLYSQIIGADAVPETLLRPLVELADGMPLYAHEYVRMLIEQGTLRRGDRSWVVDPGGALPMPAGVQAVIGHRIDLLGQRERLALQAASVVGARFWPGAVAAALAVGRDLVEDALRGLMHRDLVREQPTSRMAGEPEYRFRHVLVGDVCYERLPRADRLAWHTRTADWLGARLDTRGTELAELLAHHRYTAYVTARELGQPTGPYAASALPALCHSARRDITLNAFDAAAADVARAESLVDAATAEVERLGVELLAQELAFHTDAQEFVTGDGPTRLRHLADRLYRTGDQPGAARAWTLLGQVAWLTTDRASALRYLDRAVELFDTSLNTPEKAHAFAELGRLHMLNYEHVPALAASEVAAEIADGLGLVELRSSASITIGMCRYQSGARDGLIDLREAAEFCRAHQLPSLRRAQTHLAHALREEGDHSLADRLLLDGSPGGSHDALRALQAGDWHAFLAAAETVLHEGSRAVPSTAVIPWDLQVHGVRGWVRALRGDLVGAVEDAELTLYAARRSGFRRLVWSALAHGALTHAVLGKDADAVELLRELTEGWRVARVIASGEWVAAAAHTAARLGPDGAGPLADLLREVPRHTPWSRAALASVSGVLAAAAGEPEIAAAHHLDAAERFTRAGNRTDRMLALAAAVTCHPTGTGPQRDELVSFASANLAPALAP